jgi:photosystem II stability/assembly factor-like uncharacterized protein
MDRRMIAAVAGAVLVLGTIAVVLLVRRGSVVTPPTAQQSASPVATATPTAGPSPSAPFSPIPMPTSTELNTPSADVVWAYVGGVALFRSSDRGDTWQQRPLPSEPSTGLTFVDQTHGWSLSGGPQAPACPAAPAIWQTADAGSTWQRVNATGLASAGCKSALSFVDRARGFLAASDSSGPPVIYRTDDGGRTWSPSSPLPAPSGRPSLGIPPGPVRAFGSTLLVTAGSSVYRSADGGASWSYVADAPGREGSPGLVTATRWLSLSTPSTSQETVDAGATWHPYPCDYGQAAPVAPVVLFGSPQVGYATVRGGIQRTLDGGLHWRTIHTPGT